MPDISMCFGYTCPNKDFCYRHTAEPNPYRQAYFANDPREDNGECNFFGPNNYALDNMITPVRTRALHLTENVL